MIESLTGATVVIAGQELYTAEVFDACPELRLIVRFGLMIGLAHGVARHDREQLHYDSATLLADRTTV